MSNAKRSFGNSKDQESQGKSPLPYFVDRKLVPRVREYLCSYENGSQGDVDEILKYLQMTFPEYRRKKTNILRQSIVKVLLSSPKNDLQTPGKRPKFYRKRQNDDNVGNIDASFGNAGDSSSSTEDQEGLVEAKDTNMINNSMHQIYAKVARGGFSTPIYGDLPSGSERCDSALNIKSNVSTGEDTKFSQQLREEADNFLGNKVFNKVKSSEVSTPIPSPIGSKSGKSDDDRPKQNLIKKRRKDEPEKPVSSKQSFKPIESEVKLADVGGYESSLEEVVKLLFHLKHPEVFQRLGVKPPRGFLLHGPPGCGKTLLANAIAGELQLPYFRLAATEVISGVSGESEEKLRELFSIALASAPSIIFLDEIDAIAPNRETASKEMERRIVSQLLVCMDDLNRGDADVMIIGATNRPDSLDPGLRRAGRFDREICLGIPDREARSRILQVVCRGLRLSEDFHFNEVASLTPGFVGADLVSLTREAAMFAVQRIFTEMERKTRFDVSTISMEVVENEAKSQSELLQDGSQGTSSLKLGAFSWLGDQPTLQAEELDSLYIEQDDFKLALATVQPSAKREGFATVPDVTWQDIGALEDIRAELSLAVLAPVRHQEQFAALGISNPPGILLAGPPGCGKTLLAKAIANEAGINFISVKGPELLNMYVGESEKAVRQVFQRARNSAPCVIFFDEIDALCPKRSDVAGSSASSRVVNQLLTEMDGLQARKQVFLMGATNRPDIIDSAILRPGRLDKILFVGLPTPVDRVKILKTITKNGTKPKLAMDVNLESIGNDVRCERFSGADLSALVREASLQKLKDSLKNGAFESSQGAAVEVTSIEVTAVEVTAVEVTAVEVTAVEVTAHHFEQAFQKLRPSVSSEDTHWYEQLRKRFGIKSC